MLVSVECLNIHRKPPCRHRDSNHGIDRFVPSTDLSLKESINGLALILDLLKHSVFKSLCTNVPLLCTTTFLRQFECNFNFFPCFLKFYSFTVYLHLCPYLNSLFPRIPGYSHICSQAPNLYSCHRYKDRNHKSCRQTL